MNAELRYHHKNGWCTFCDEVQDRQTSNFRHLISYTEIPNVILKDTEHFFVVPGLGPMKQCYLLILPKESYVSIASLPSAWDDELMSLKKYIRKILSQLYCSPLMFEHGPAVENSLMAGCCVEHAHIHVFATQANFVDDLQMDFASNIFGTHSEYRLKKITSHDELRLWIQHSVSYLWYETNFEEQWVVPLVKNVPSQYMRRLLAKQLGLPDPEWDWALYPGKEKIIETWNLLSKHFAGNPIKSF